MGEIIGVVSGKGGVGKTTITACLGAALSHAAVSYTHLDVYKRQLLY